MNDPDSEQSARLFGRAQLSGARAIVCGGQTFSADDDTAYVEFVLCHALPVTTYQGSALHPGTVFNSFAALRGKNFNLGHVLRAYDPDASDRALGTVMAVEWRGPAERPAGGFGIANIKADAPGIRGVAVIHKNWESAKAALGMKNPTVSIEMAYRTGVCAFAIPTDGGGWDLVRWSDAPAKLRACWQPPAKSEATNNWAIQGEWEGKKPVLLCGGIDGTVRMMGVGLVSFGYEPEAAVEQILAGELDPYAHAIDHGSLAKWERLRDAMSDLVR